MGGMSSSVDWDWANRLPSLAIFEAAGLSMGFELNILAPDGRRFTGRDYIEPPKEYGERVFLAYMSVQAGDLPRSREAERNQTFDPKAAFDTGQFWEIDPADFRRWCDAKGFPVPAEWLPRGYTPATHAPVVPATASETKEQRQDRRLKACIDAGLPMDTKDALSRLPDGVGNVADCEKVTRQAFSTDVKAALKRRESTKREGSTVHRV
jgi:hypothetical protein